MTHSSPDSHAEDGGGREQAEPRVVQAASAQSVNNVTCTVRIVAGLHRRRKGTVVISIPQKKKPRR
jgi:hypothetical protein